MTTRLSEENACKQDLIHQKQLDGSTELRDCNLGEMMALQLVALHRVLQAGESKWCLLDGLRLQALEAYCQACYLFHRPDSVNMVNYINTDSLPCATQPVHKFPLTESTLSGQCEPKNSALTFWEREEGRG